MPDISKCNNGMCPLRHSCYRYTSPPSMWQAYAEFNFTTVDEEVECNYYMEEPEYFKKQKNNNNEKL